MASTGTISGIASGIQWRDLVDQIMSADEARTVTPLVNDASDARVRSTAWATYESAVAKIGDAAKSIGTGSVDFLATNVGLSSGGRSVFSATPATSGTPGTYQIDVRSLARAHKLSGATFASATAALGLSGTIHVNGATVTIAGTDTLSGIRDKFNAANAGASRSGVSASILSASNGTVRLTLSSDTTGAAAIELAQSAGTALASLGLVGTTRLANDAGNGATRSFAFADHDTAIADLLELSSSPAASTLAVGNRTISVNLATDSLDDLVDKLDAAGISAEVKTEKNELGTRYRLSIGGIVSGNLADADTSRMLELLGVMNHSEESVAQVVRSEVALDDAVDDPATGSTLLVDLHSGGSSKNIVDGDTLRWYGTKPDGTAFTSTLAVSPTTTVEELRAAIAGGFGASAAMTLESDGTFTLVDAAGGESRLALVMQVEKADDSVVDFGRLTATTTGYTREVTAASDAVIRIDGVEVRRSTNTIADAVDGATLTLTNADPGNTAELRVTRDPNATVTLVKQLVSAYNDAAAYVKKVTAAGGALPFNNAIRSSLRQITTRLQQQVTGLTDVTRAGQIGLTFDKAGVLSIDATVLKAAIADDLPAVRALLGRTIATPDGVSYGGDTDRTHAGSFALAITAAATGATATGSGFSGSYVDGGTPDRLVITDGATLHTATISLATGDDIDAIVDRLNAAFEDHALRLAASASSGQLVITGSTLGTAGKFNITLSGAGDPAAQLGIATGQFVGTNVVGTFDGIAGVGVGDRLTGAVGTAAEGLQIRHTSGAPLSGTVVHVPGLGDLLASLSTAVTRDNDGLVATQTDSLDRRADALDARADLMRDRLSRRRELLIAQFTRMEQAMGLLQAQTVALTNQTKALQSNTS